MCCTGMRYLALLNITTFPILPVLQDYDSLSKELKPVIESIVTSSDDNFTNVLLALY